MALLGYVLALRLPLIIVIQLQQLQPVSWNKASFSFPVSFSPLCLQTSPVWSPRASLQWLWFHCEPLRCDCDQRSRGNHSDHGDREAPAARAAQRRRRVRGHGQRRRQEGRHRHDQSPPPGESMHTLNTQERLLHPVQATSSSLLFTLFSFSKCK